MLVIGVIVSLVINLSGQPVKTPLHPALHFLLLFSALCSAIVFLLLKLETKIDSTGIFIRFSFIPGSRKQWNWGDIQRAYIRTYKPVTEYGGWGIRYTFRNGRAFNVSGKTGLQLELKNGKKVLIGTQQEAELNKVLAYLKQQYHIDAIEATGGYGR